MIQKKEENIVQFAFIQSRLGSQNRKKNQVVHSELLVIILNISAKTVTFFAQIV